jgi:hypothetical protein
MIAASSLMRSLIVYCLSVPAAVFLGYMLATPMDVSSYMILGVVFCLIMAPLVLRHHHAWLIASWNMTTVVFFLPGRPQLWLLMSWLSLMIAFSHYILHRKEPFLHVASINRPLILLLVITVVIAKARGGLGLASMGADTFGGRRYFMIVTAILGYFAITSRQIPIDRVPFYIALYFVGAATEAIGDLAVFVNPAFYFVFLVFPVGSAGVKAIINDPGLKESYTPRLAGVGVACTAFYYVMLSRNGVKNLLTWNRPLKTVIFLAFLGASMIGGFRSALIFFLMLFGILFYLEGLMRSRMLPVFLLLGIAAASIVIPFADHMPLTIQRSLSFLPIKVDPMVRVDAQASTEWRLGIWRNVVPQIPEYLLLGKGYSISAKDLAMSQINTMMGDNAAEGTEIVGDYHNGPLSVIIPLGLPGTLAFIWLLVVALRTLHRNYLYGNPALASINRFLLAYFIARLVLFLTIFGNFYSDLPGFLGLVGLGVSINGGVAQPVVVEQPKLVFDRFRLHPGARKPANA